MVIFKFRPDLNRVDREVSKQLDIYRVLKERILFLEYAPGRMLNERALTEEFAISRTPLREALNRHSEASRKYSDNGMSHNLP